MEGLSLSRISRAERRKRQECSPTKNGGQSRTPVPTKVIDCHEVADNPVGADSISARNIALSPASRELSQRESLGKPPPLGEVAAKPTERAYSRNTARFTDTAGATPQAAGMRPYGHSKTFFKFLGILKTPLKKDLFLKRVLSRGVGQSPTNPPYYHP